MNRTLLEQSLKDSVQVKRDAQTEGAWVIALNEYRNPYVAPWGTRACERDLRRWSRDPDNWMAMGAFSNLIKKVVDTPWIVDGPETGINRARYFQDILRQADFGGNGGSGWEVWLGKGLLDLCRQNGGWYFEKIGPGDPLKPLTGAITGIAHLDSLRCYPTGDPEYPVIYYNYNNERHILHYTRVGHIVDMPDGDEFNPGYGYSPLYRSMGIVYQQWLMMRYNRVKLDELPAPGFASIKGMSRQTFEDAVDKFVERRANDTPPAYGNLVTLFGLDAALPVELTLTTFSQAPEGFDYPTWLNVQANALALTIGVDKQDIWELATRGLGTGAQSEVLHEKSQAKMYGFLLATIERVLNDVLPESCEFQFKPTDTFASLATAQTATAWATYTQTLGTDFTPNEKRALQAAQVPAAHDVLMDDAGQMIELPDSDVKPETDVSLTDATTVPGGDTAAPAAAAKPTVSAGDSTTLPASKDFDATREQFVANLTDLIHGSVSDDVSRRRAGVVMRAQLNSAGKQARLDGLVDGGVTTGLSDADLNAHAVWLATQSQFVTDFLGSVYKSGLSDAEITQHAEMWANKSLQSAYFEGLNSADADGTYEFFGEDGKESCADCRRLKGTQMRMSEWTATKQRPGVDTENFDCGGWQCKHGLRRVSATSKGVKKKDFDPAQPRDELGMWTDTGGGLGGEGKPTSSDAPPKFQNAAEARAHLEAQGVHVGYTVKDVINNEADAFEKAHGWDATHTREQFVKNWTKNLKGMEASDEQSTHAMQAIANAHAQGQIGSDVTYSILRQDADVPSYGAEYKQGSSVIRIYPGSPDWQNVPTRPMGEKVSLVADHYTDPLQGAIVHEYGHHLQKLDPSITQRASGVLADAQQSPEVRASLRNSISSYALTNGDELASEAYSLKHAPGYSQLPENIRGMTEHILGK